MFIFLEGSKISICLLIERTFEILFVPLLVVDLVGLDDSLVVVVDDDVVEENIFGREVSFRDEDNGKLTLFLTLRIVSRYSSFFSLSS